MGVSSVGCAVCGMWDDFRLGKNKTLNKVDEKAIAFHPSDNFRRKPQIRTRVSSMPFSDLVHLSLPPQENMPQAERPGLAQLAARI